MGFFADTQSSMNNIVNSEKFQNYRPTPILPGSVPSTFVQALKEVGKKYLVDTIRSIDIHYDPCNILVTSDIGTYWYRNPYCQPPPPPPPEFEPIPDADNQCARNTCKDGRVITTVWRHSDAINPYPNQYSSILYNDAQKISNFNYDSDTKALETYLDLPIPPYISNRSVTIESLGEKENKRIGREVYIDGYLPNINPNSVFLIKVVNLDGSISIIEDTFTRTELGDYFGNIEFLFNNYRVAYDSFENGTTIRRSTQIGYGWFTTRFKKDLCEINPEPPPPPPPEECDCMAKCCPELDQTLLKLILKRIGQPKQVEIFDEDLTRTGAQKANRTPQSLNDYFKLAVERVEIANRIIGIENFPVEVPETMIEPHKEGVFAGIFKFIDGDKKIKVNSIAEIMVWMAKQDSAVLGEFHQVIEYETEVKGKKATIVLPNVAESLKEIVLLTAQMAKQNNVQTELIFKIAAELVATRAVATKGTSISQDIQDYLDYPTDTKKAKIKTAISLPKFTTNKEGIPIATSESENPKAFLKPGEVEYVYDDWTGSNSLHDQLLDLMQLAAMLRAIYFQRTDKG